MKYYLHQWSFRIIDFIQEADEVFKCFFNAPRMCLDDALDNCYPYVYLSCNEGVSYTIPAGYILD